MAEIMSFQQTNSLSGSFSRYLREIPDDLEKYPSMISVNEKRFLYNIAKEYYVGDGVIFDAGIFLGASSKLFGMGVKANIAKKKIFTIGKPVRSFDLAIVNASMVPFFDKHHIKIDAKVGESFAPWLTTALTDVSDNVQLSFGDVTETMHSVVQPIEIAFLDVLKLKVIANMVMRKVFPLLIPGRSIVIQQDYFHEAVEFIKTYQENFMEYFDYIGEISCSAIFLCKKQISQDIADTLCGDISGDEEERLASIALQRSIDPGRRFLMSLSKARTIAKIRGGQAAMLYLDHVRGEFPPSLFANYSLANRQRFEEALTTCEDFCFKRVRKSKAS